MLLQHSMDYFIQFLMTLLGTWMVLIFVAIFPDHDVIIFSIGGLLFVILSILGAIVMADFDSPSYCDWGRVFPHFGVMAVCDVLGLALFMYLFSALCNAGDTVFPLVRGGLLL